MTVSLVPKLVVNCDRGRTAKLSGLSLANARVTRNELPTVDEVGVSAYDVVVPVGDLTIAPVMTAVIAAMMSTITWPAVRVAVIDLRR